MVFVVVDGIKLWYRFCPGKVLLPCMMLIATHVVTDVKAGAYIYALNK